MIWLANDVVPHEAASCGPNMHREITTVAPQRNFACPRPGPFSQTSFLESKKGTRQPRKHRERGEKKPLASWPLVAVPEGACQPSQGFSGIFLKCQPLILSSAVVKSSGSPRRGEESPLRFYLSLPHNFSISILSCVGLPLQEDTMEESGWKLVHGDVFRPPQYPMILSSLLGSGIQLFCMILIVICKLHNESVELP